MPVVTTAQVVQSLETVAIHLGGGISVSVRTTIEGAEDSVKQYAFTKEETLPHWTELGDPNKSRWDDLCDLLYGLLIEKGHITGTIS